LRSFLAPLIAPGVLYNSIKSGIAVDFPVYTGSHVVTQISSGSSNRVGHANSTDYDLRVPFEAIYEPERYLAGKELADIEAHPSASMKLFASWNGSTVDELYRLMIHNFLAETTNMFMKELTTVNSLPDNDPNFCNWGEDPKDVYMMDVHLKRGSNDFLVGNYHRDSAFGPPSVSNVSIFGTTRGSTTGSKEFINDSYDPYTPPWFGGVDLVSPSQPNKELFSQEELDLASLAANGGGDLGALARIEFKPDNVLDFMGADITHDGRPTLQQIMSASVIRYYAFANDGTSHSTGSTSTKNIMHVSASLLLKNMIINEDIQITEEGIRVAQAEPRKSLRWSIGTKAEFPVLNFRKYSQANISSRTSISASGDNLHRTSIGMWHQYGEIPITNKETVVLQIQDVPIRSRQTGSLARLLGFDQTPSPIGKLRERFIIKEAIVAVPFIEKDCEPKFFRLHQDSKIARKMVDTAMARSRKTMQPDVRRNRPGTPGKSVVDMIDKMQDYVFPPSFDFITYDGRDGDPEVDPIAMYIFEFEKALTKKDLADIWQNLPPSGLVAGQKGDIDKDFEHYISAPVSHRLNMSNELLDDVDDKLKWLVFKVKQKAKMNFYNTIEDSYGTRFMGAEASSRKTNQKRNLTAAGTMMLDKRRSANKGDKTLYAEFEPAYSYNWPYDYFSLVELARVETDVLINDMNRLRKNSVFPETGSASRDPECPEKEEGC
jgi:hypothetical protein